MKKFRERRYSSKASMGGAVIVSAFVLYLDGAVHEYLALRFFYTALALAAIAVLVPGEKAYNAWGRRVLLCLIALFIFLLATDICLRPFGQRFTPFDYYMYRGVLTPRDNKQESKVEKHFYGGLGLLMPEKYRQYRTVKTEIDRYGYRNYPKSANTVYDVVTLGDSTSYGWSSSQEKIWPVVLEKAYGLKTYNLAQIGTSPWEEYIIFGAEFGRLKTNKKTVVVWALFTGNDFDEYYGRPVSFTPLTQMEKTRFALSAFRNRSPLSVLFIKNINRYYAGKRGIMTGGFPNGEDMLFLKHCDTARKRTYAQIKAHRNYGRLSETIAAMKKLADYRNVTVKAALLPDKEEVYSWALERKKPWSSSLKPSGFSAALKELFDKNGIQFLDLKPEMVKASREMYEKSGATLFWLDDIHLSDEGHEFVANAVARELLGKKEPSK